MKTKTAKLPVINDVATIGQHVFFPVFESQTSGGKKCIVLQTDKRLSVPDFKQLMADITLAGGYGFMKFYPEHKARYITATGIDGHTLQSLAAQYVWTVAEPKVKAEKSGKASNTKKDKQTEAKQQAITDIDPVLFAQFQAFQAMLKAGK
jgi:hypothetical protein